MKPSSCFNCDPEISVWIVLFYVWIWGKLEVRISVRWIRVAVSWFVEIEQYKHDMNCQQCLISEIICTGNRVLLICVKFKIRLIYHDYLRLRL